MLPKLHQHYLLRRRVPVVIWFRHQKSRSVDFIHHLKIFVGLWHWLISSSLLLEILMESTHLLELSESVIDIINSALRYLSDLFLILSGQVDLSILLVLSES